MIQDIGIVGAGAMGRGIAQIAAQAGYRVFLYDQSADQVQAAIAALRKTWAGLVAKDKMSADQAQAAETALIAAASLETMAGCQLIVEAIVERLDVKQSLFQQLEALVGDDCILATNTSSLSVTAIAKPCRLPQRVAGFHFFNPVPLMKVVEVIGGIKTAPHVLDQLDQLASRCGHRAVRAADTPGFIVNHAGRGYGTEALMLLSEGVADIPTIDAVLREQVSFGGRGFRLGPFELMDLTGLDVSHPVMESVYRQFYDEPRFRPSALAAQRVAGGVLGRKTGVGFYSYVDGQAQPSGPASDQIKPVPPTTLSVYVDRHSPGAPAVLDYLEQQGITPESSPTPSEHALILVSPWGKDASSAAQGFDARRVVAVDTLFALVGAKRRVLMKTPVTSDASLHAAQWLFAQDGAKVTVLNDSAGFIAQRVLAVVVAIAAEMAQHRIASPTDIDLAVQIGLNYPQGPLAMGDTIGADKLHEILRNLHALTADPRYRPSNWLRRRAQLGISLHHPD